MAGLGLYTYPEAGRLLNVGGDRLRRWVLGYDFEHDDRPFHSDPVIQTDLPLLDAENGIAFADLIEAQFVANFVRAGVSLQHVRRVAAIARDRYRATHPFSRQRFRTDGSTIFAEFAKAEGDPELLDLVKDQYAMRRMIAPSLKGDFDFDGEATKRWWPLGRGRAVVLDPDIAFGQPSIAEFGIPTRTLVEAMQVYGSARTVARWFDVPARAVEQAVRFERRSAA